MFPRKAPIPALLLLVNACTGWAQSEVMQEALKPGTPLEESLRVLTDEIGGRVSGTAQLDQAAAWAVTAFHQAGADVVGTEEFTIPQSWTESNTQVNVVAPTRFHVRAQAVA